MELTQTGSRTLSEQQPQLDYNGAVTFPAENTGKLWPLTAEAESLLSERALSTSHRESRPVGDFLPDCAASLVFLHLDFAGTVPMSHLGQST